jgi:hypothetical protein
MALVVGLAPVVQVLPAYAAGKIFTVNNTPDAPDAMPGDGKCETASGNNICTLRAAIQETNALAGADIINLQSGVTYTLTRVGADNTALNGDLDITDDLTINSAGSSVIDGNSGVTKDRVFDIHSGTVAISHITIQNGAAHEAGGIENSGTLTLDHSSVSNNTAYSWGGGIRNNGILTLQSSSVSGNKDIGPTANGGGIHNGGTLTLIDSLVSGNTADGGGGGINNGGTATLANTSISGNNAPYGGGIRNSWKLTLNNSTVSNNAAAYHGGGIANESFGVATLTNTTINSNTSDTGGGIHNSATLIVANSTLNWNNAMGGADNDGGALYNYYHTATLTNSTLSGNKADNDGGGIFTTFGTMNLRNVTIAYNQADSDQNAIGTGGGVYFDSNGTGSVNTRNSIIDENYRNGFFFSDDCAGALSSEDYNLIRTTTGCSISGLTTHNKTGVSAKFVKLQNNGGPTETQALSAGSPAIDAGDPNGCKDDNNATLTSDQRGYVRPVGVACDIGAYEYGSAAVKQNQSIIFGQLPNQMASAAPFQIYATATSGLKVDFSAAGECSVGASSLNQGKSSATVTLSGKGGICSITAHQAGNANYNASADVMRTFAITTQNQTISFAPLPSKTLGDPPFTISATASSGLPVSVVPDIPQVCDVIGNTVTLNSSGICTLVASQEGDNQFSPAPDVVQTFAIFDPAKKGQTITFGALPNRQVGEAPFSVSATASSGLPVSFITATFVVCQVGAGKITVMAAGICTIVAQQEGNSTFNPASTVARSFVVIDPLKKAQTITFTPLPNKSVGDAPFSVSASASSGLGVAFTASGKCSVNGSTVTLSGPAGNCTITAHQSGDGTYSAAPDVARSFAINDPAKQNQTISFGALPNRSVGDAPFNVSASASSGLALSFTASGQCSISGTMVTLTGAGSCTITAHQAGDATHNAAADVAQTFQIGASAPAHWTVYLPLVVR